MVKIIKMKNTNRLFLMSSIVFAIGFFVNLNFVSADSCGSAYGDSYFCINVSASTDLSKCKGNCPSNPTNNSSKCCLRDGVTLTDKTPCAKNFACIDPMYVSATNLEKCTTSCVSETTARGKCCPLTTTDPEPETPKDGSSGGGGIITCGKTVGSMCTLCDIIKGINTIIQYLLRIGIGFALLSITIGGVLYIVSAGESGLMETGKKTIFNAAIGLVIMLGAWLIISTTLRVIGANGNLGISGVTKWGTFDCARRE